MTTTRHAVIVGGGVGGLGAALALSRAGHRVTILERDATPTPTDPDGAFAWDRRGAPQVRHSHALLARLHNLLRDRYPDVLEQLLAAGATEIHFCADLPPDITDREPRPGDEDLVAIACRRTTFEWVLRTAVLADERVTLLDGVGVAGLGARRDAATGRPQVTGVAVQPSGSDGSNGSNGSDRSDSPDGSGATIDADLVVAATGRRSPVPRWLEALGVQLETREEDTGIVYLSRFYRLRDPDRVPDQTGPIGGDLGYLKYAVFLGDNHTFSVTFAVGTHDDELRAALLDPDTFDRAARALPATAPWAAPGLADPITPVNVMAGLLNRRIRFLDEADEPRVLGFHALGDAHTCTNPLYGRGCSLAMVQATLLADALAAHPDDPAARAVAYEQASRREIEPWYKAAVAQDRQSRAAAARAASARAAASDEVGTDEVVGDPDVATPPDAIADLLRDGLLPAVRTDAVVFRAFVRGFNLLAAPDALLQDADVIGRVLAVYQDRDARPPEPVLGPPRDQMIDALAAP